MLVVSRKISEKVIIALQSGELVEVTVGKIKGNSVSIAIKAPKDIKIAREEIFTKFMENHREPVSGIED